jgi:hypothetical protein
MARARNSANARRHALRPMGRSVCRWAHHADHLDRSTGVRPMLASKRSMEAYRLAPASGSPSTLAWTAPASRLAASGGAKPFSASMRSIDAASDIPASVRRTESRSAALTTSGFAYSAPSPAGATRTPRITSDKLIFFSLPCGLRAPVSIFSLSKMMDQEQCSQKPVSLHAVPQRFVAFVAI